MIGVDVYLYPDGLRVATPEDIERWESEREMYGQNVRLFVALFSYNPAVMSPNPETMEEELPFEQGQVIKVKMILIFSLIQKFKDVSHVIIVVLHLSHAVMGLKTAGCVLLQIYGDKDADGFYSGESGGRFGFVPSNMVSEIPVEDEELKQNLLQQGFLPEETPSIGKQSYIFK